MSRYSWIPAIPIPRTRRRDGGRPIRTVPSTPCRRCGYDPVGTRKKCPACLARQDRTDAD